MYSILPFYPLNVTCEVTDVFDDCMLGEGDCVTLKTYAGTSFSASTIYTLTVIHGPTQERIRQSASHGEGRTARGGGFEPPSSFEHWMFAYSNRNEIAIQRLAGLGHPRLIFA